MSHDDLQLSLGDETFIICSSSTVIQSPWAEDQQWWPTLRRDPVTEFKSATVLLFVQGELEPLLLLPTTRCLHCLRAWHYTEITIGAIEGLCSTNRTRPDFSCFRAFPQETAKIIHCGMRYLLIETHPPTHNISRIVLQWTAEKNPFSLE